MASLPTGAITFLFSDIEGSTRLLGVIEDDYHRVLEEHRQILRSAFSRHAGHEIGTGGDSFFVVFQRAADALAAAIQGQRSLMQHAWPPNADVRVRMGLHTGEAKLAGSDYVGLSVHQASRICSAAHGGQIVISTSTRELVEDEPPDNVTFNDLGLYRLRDLAPGHLHQVCHPDLAADFPPLRTIEIRRHNLPAQLTSFVGREKELAALEELVSSFRLVTITGAGGSGKTRLALETAATLLERFRDGTWLVDLAAVGDPDLVLPQIATALGVREQEDRSLEASLDDFLAEKEMLLIFDNCEHLVGECGRVADHVLRASPASSIIVTTREALGIGGETAWRIPSLAVPDPDARIPIDAACEYEAISLFITRAHFADPSFVANASDVPLLIQICRRLDGIPLAIELAAARLKSLSLKQIADRLDDRFRLLTGGSRSALPRQQTLRALVDWSYGLLSEDEREALAQASVFAGGFTLEAAESILERPSHLEVLDHLSALVDKSLMVFDRSAFEGRYRLLETIRQYGRERLFDSDNATSARNRHLDFFLSCAETTEPLLQGPDQKAWLDHLEADLENFRAALEWSASDESGAKALRLAAALWRFWWVRGYWSEGRRWLDRGLAAGADDPRLRAKALWASGYLARLQGDLAEARTLQQRSLALFRLAGDEHMAAYPLFDLGVTATALGGDRQEAISDLEQSVAIGKKFDDKQVTTWALIALGTMHSSSGGGDTARALSLWEEALELARESGDVGNVAMALSSIAALTGTRGGDYAHARSLHSEILQMRRELGDKLGILQSLLSLGVVAMEMRDVDDAQSCVDEALQLARELGNKPYTRVALGRVADVALALGDAATADKCMDEVLAKARAVDSPIELAWALNEAAWMWHLHGKDAEALPWVEESVAIYRRNDRSSRVPPVVLHTLAEVLRAEGELQQAKALIIEALAQRPRGARVAANLLEAIAGLETSLSNFERAARLFGAAEAIRQSEYVLSHRRARAVYDRDIAALRAGAGERLKEAWGAGRAMSLDEAIAHAIREAEQG